MKIKTFIILACLLIVLLNNCKKQSNPTPGNTSYIAHKVFPTSSASYWKAYYYAPSGGPGNIEFACDSIFLSTDTIGLKIVSNNNLDTNWVTFNIVKVSRFAKLFDSTNWHHFGIANYGIFRVDTVNSRVIGVHTVDFTTVSPSVYPTNLFYNEWTLFDYNLITNDTAYLRANWYFYHCNVHVDSLPFNGYYLKRQYFTNISNNDTVSHRIQFGCILNMIPFTIDAVQNTFSEPNAFLSKLVFYENNNDSIELEADTRTYP